MATAGSTRPRVVAIITESKVISLPLVPARVTVAVTLIAVVGCFVLQAEELAGDFELAFTAIANE